MSRWRVIGVNLAVILLLLGAFEVVFGAWFFYWPFHVRTLGFASCRTPDYFWAYCPKINAVNRLYPEDGGDWIDNYVNLSRVRVAKASEMDTMTDFDDYSVYLTGDSFMQADEVAFEQTVGFFIGQATGRRTLQHGYSTWAPIQYLNFVNTINLTAKDDVFVFVNVTDVAPENHNSNYFWREREHEIVNGRFQFILPDETPEPGAQSRSVQSHIEGKSILFKLSQRVMEVVERVRSEPEAEGVSRYPMYDEWKGFATFDDVITERLHDCSLLNSVYRETSPATLDFLVFAFDSSCWPKRFHEALESGLSDLRQLEDYVTNAGATLHIIVFPMGWSFENENTIGKQHPYYAMGPRARITSEPLVDYFEEYFDSPVLSLEQVLIEHDTVAENELYFAVDGHWTAEAHEIIGRSLGVYLENDSRSPTE